MRRDGRTEDTWFTFSYTPLRDDDGKVAGILCAALDVTDQVSAKRGEETALEELRVKSGGTCGRQPGGSRDHRRAQCRTPYPDCRRCRRRADRRRIRRLLLQRADEQRRELHALHALRRRPRGLRQVPDAAQHRGLRADLQRRRHRPLRRHHARTRATARTRRITACPKGHLPVSSYLAVPVNHASGEVIGGLFFGHGQPGRFHRAAEASLVGLAGQGGRRDRQCPALPAAKRRNRRAPRRAEDALRKLNEMLEVRVAAEIAERQQAEAALAAVAEDGSRSAS